jgi:hypothetical protein
LVSGDTVVGFARSAADATSDVSLNVAEAVTPPPIAMIVFEPAVALAAGVTVQVNVP